MKGRADPRWVRSKDASECMLCYRSFGTRLVVRKHHCRSCGWAVCGRCSAHALRLDRWLEKEKPHVLRETKSPEALRVCDSCFQLRTEEEAPPAPEEPQPQPPAAGEPFEGKFTG